MDALNQTSKNSARLNIALVTETYLPEVNGVAITMGRMVDGLLQRGHHIHLIRPKQHETDHAADTVDFCETLTHGMPIPGYSELKLGLPARRKLLRLWTAQRPDIVHIATEGPLGWSALSAARKLKLPVCSDFHTNFQNYTTHYGIGLLQKPIAAYLRHFHNKTDCTLVPTRSLQYELMQTGYRNVSVVSRGVDAALFHPDKRDAALRTTWSADETTPVAILVSRIAAEKNLAVVIQAYRAMQSVNSATKLVIVGDGPERAALQQQNPDVIFAGMQTGEALAKHYASADIFLYPSLTETYGNVTVEAMCSGLAVIAYDYAAAHQHMLHNVNGLLAPYNDSDIFVSLARELSNDAERVQRLRHEARHTAQTLTWEHIISQLEMALFATAQVTGEEYVQPKIATATD